MGTRRVEAASGFRVTLRPNYSTEVGGAVSVNSTGIVLFRFSRRTGHHLVRRRSGQ